MKLKKKVKLFLILILIIALAITGYFAYKTYFTKEEIKEVKVINEIDKYGYKLKENKSNKYKKLFEELKEILNKDPINEEEYVKKISEMFIYDFYTLSDKLAKTDIGGVDFVQKDILENFLQNAQNTYYKYVESNIYNNRKQSLPTVSDITIGNVEQKEFVYGNQKDENAYYVTLTWNYTDDQFSSYQKEAELVFIHEDSKLVLVELQ